MLLNRISVVGNVMSFRSKLSSNPDHPERAWPVRVPMSLTLLLDLDDTLLDTNLDAFMPAYFQALSQHMANSTTPNTMLRALIAGVNLMNESEDSTRTLQEIFDSDFYPKLGFAKDEMVALVEDFYDHVFPTLSQHTEPRPE